MIKKRVWTLVIALLGYFFITGITAVVILLTNITFSADADDMTRQITEYAQSPNFLFNSIFFLPLASLLVPILAALISSEKLSDRLNLGKSRHSISPLELFGYFILGIASSASIVLIFEKFAPGSAAILNALGKLVNEASGLEFIALVFSIGVVAPIAEELLCRGYLQSRLQSRFGPWVAVLTTAAIFGAIHTDVVQSSYAFIIGVILGWVTVKSGSIRYAIALHMLNNLFSCFIMRFDVSAFDYSDSNFAFAAVAWTLVVFAFGFLYLKNKGKVPSEKAKFLTVPSKPRELT